MQGNRFSASKKTFANASSGVRDETLYNEGRSNLMCDILSKLCKIAGPKCVLCP